jgi:predicted nucleic acid-binding protein
MATTALNLIEVNYILLRDRGRHVAEAFYRALLPTLVIFEHKIPDANIMRLEMKKRNVSAADCIGYMVAQSAGIKFLTGDKEFENMMNVEFVK